MNCTAELPVKVSGNSKRTLLGKHALFKVLTVAAVGIGFMLYVAMAVSKNQDSPTASDRRETMFLGKENSTANHRIPPIDAAVPAKTETATFALG
jgi:hypothetical protein